MCTPPDGDLDPARAALRERIDAVGLRATAREVGLSPAAIRSLANLGSRPTASTLALVSAWYLAYLATPPPPARREIRRTLSGLARHLPEDDRHRVVDEMQRILADATRKMERIADKL